MTNRLLSGLRHRLGVLIAYAQHRPTHLPFRQFLRYITSAPPSINAARYIERVETSSEWQTLHFHSLQTPLITSPTLPLGALQECTCEILDPSNFHYYEHPATTVNPHDVVVDCGAAEGLFALTVANRCQHVYVIEPMPAFHKGLQRTFRDFANITLIPMGLSDKEEVLTFSDDSLSSKASRHGTSIPCTTIDSLFHDKGIHIHYIKADIEGAESKMIAGARKTIAASRPKMAITTYHDENNAREMMNQITSICSGYQFTLKGLHESGRPIMLHAWHP